MAKARSGKTSVKHMQIDKAQAKVALIVAGLVFVLVFSIFVARTLWEQRAFQARVIQEKEVVVQQLRDNLEAAERLELSYKAFVESPTNAIGGITVGGGDRDGDNAKITLDALPSQYDYPALITSVEKILDDHGYNIESIAGSDDQIAQVSAEESEPVEMPFEFQVKTTPSRALDLLHIIERSIRPINIEEIRMNADTAGELTFKVNAYSYFQPEEQLTTTTKEVR